MSLGMVGEYRSRFFVVKDLTVILLEKLNKLPSGWEQLNTLPDDKS